MGRSVDYNEIFKHEITPYPMALAPNGNKYNSQRIDVVLDHYKENSIKDSARFKRGGQSSINRIINSSDVPLPQQWHMFIHSTYNKQQLTNFISEQLCERSRTVDFEFSTSGCFKDVLKYRGMRNDTFLISTHEEADTRILLHILSAKRLGYTRCIIDCKDTDVLVLLAHFKDCLTPEIWMVVGTKESKRFIAVHELNMNPELLKNLPAFDALTGCDTTSQFAGFGKKTCWKFYQTYHALLSGVGVGDFCEELFSRMQLFVIKLYGGSSDVTCIDYLRGMNASYKSIDKLPPTQDSLRHHCLRVHYQTKIWLNSLNPQPQLPNILESGWCSTEGKIQPVLQTQPTVPKDLAILSSCGCKKDCAAKRCSCKKQNMSCIPPCKCSIGLGKCKNAATSMSVPQEDQDIEDSSSDSE
ncbi:hypothetical protein NQ317_016744 [Molorchus minor]|uniref:Tesmin/TSO1-like CXC domain-containing protein n=1 Tax=Molorchus minor TaxID=1323400 RepID=A0ABQ9J1D0_9CUCU|nr:hypothetical protein NQ317_016744 [Molorchus minor]